MFGDTCATGDFTAGNKEDAESDGGVNEGVNEGVNDNTGNFDFADLEQAGFYDNYNESPLSAGAFSNVRQAEEINEPEPTPVREKHNLNRTPNAKRRKSNSCSVSDTCEAIRDVMKFRADLLTSSSVTSRGSSPSDPYSIAVVIGVLKEMPGMNPNLYSKAVNHACRNAIWREAFILSPPELRLCLIESL